MQLARSRKFADVMDVALALARSLSLFHPRLQRWGLANFATNLYFGLQNEKCRPLEQVGARHHFLSTLFDQIWRTHGASVFF